MLVVTTESGSTYHFDNEALTWRRENKNVPDIRYMEGVDHGHLAAPVEPKVGERLTFFLRDHNWVVTTRVVSIA